MGRVGTADTDQVLHAEPKREFEPQFLAEDSVGTGKSGTILRLDIF